jgi:hypothetical protein
MAKRMAHRFGAENMTKKIFTVHIKNCECFTLCAILGIYHAESGTLCQSNFTLAKGGMQ